MELNPQLIDAYKKIVSNPSEYGFDFKPLDECFERSEKVIAKHILFEQFGTYINKPLPKVVFYIIMDEKFGFGDGKDENGNLGWRLKLNSEPTVKRSVATTDAQS